MGNERTTSTISSRTWMERPHDADTRKSDTDHCTRPQSPLQADSSYLSLRRTACDLTYPRKRLNRRTENASTRGTLPLLATPPSLVTNSACRLPAYQPKCRSSAGAVGHLGRFESEFWCAWQESNLLPF